ncbi:MAG: alkanesulfonate monooxygenase [Candidatus Tokpelaia sp. JSC188]|nr:MAG: alkanesulfonate monooxygenase [Candidatus Tokpelaia sp. JSC188]
MCSMNKNTSKLNFFWFIPTHGDGSYLGSEQNQRSADYRYFCEIARAVDRLGYQGVLLPTGQSCDDSWIIASALAVETERLKFLVALRPGGIMPVYAARQTAALDRLSDGRLLINIVVGGNPIELAADGIFTPHDERYSQASEFFNIWNHLLAGDHVDYSGHYYRVDEARLDLLPKQKSIPLFFGGSSDAGIEFAAKNVEEYLTWGEPIRQVEEKIARVQTKAQAEGRNISFGIRLHFIVRDTEEEAWAAAEKLISKVTDDQIAKAQERFLKQMDSVGQRVMAELHGGRRDRLIIGKNLWAGIGLVRTGAGTALVGTPQQVAERLFEYQQAGINTIIGSGYPHLEEAYRVAETLFPVLKLDADSTQRRNIMSSEFMLSDYGVVRRSA